MDHETLVNITCMLGVAFMFFIFEIYSFFPSFSSFFLIKKRYPKEIKRHRMFFIWSHGYKNGKISSLMAPNATVIL